MLIKKHYYCSNCNYHSDQEIQVTNKMEFLKKPKCPECQSRDFYFNILTFPLKDDESETGGIPHTEYTLDDYLREMLYEEQSDNTEENEIAYNQKVFKILNQTDLHDLNKELKQSGIIPIPVRSKIEYKKSPFTIDGLILKINQFLDNMKQLKSISSIQKMKETDTIKNMIHTLIYDTIDSFVYDICNYDGAYYFKEEFLNNIEVLTMLAPHLQHEILFKFLYESKLNTFNYYLQNKDIFVEQYLNILTWKEI